MAKRKTFAAEAAPAPTSGSSVGLSGSGSGGEASSTAPADSSPSPVHRIPTPAAKPPFAVSPAFGFLFARRGNGTHGLYRLIVAPDGEVLSMKEVFVGNTRMVIKKMLLLLRKINLSGGFRFGVRPEDLEKAEKVGVAP